ncbi:G-protein coupled receptor family C group 5 member C [Pleurodeles waltl]
MGRLADLLSALCLLVTFTTSEGQTSAPAGCGAGLLPIYYNLCDLNAAWGIVLEAIASAGIVSCFVLLIILVASIPFVQDSRKKSLIGTQVFFLFATLGLFGIVFDFIVKPYFSTCASRRFLFGVLFGICFSCLWAHAISLNFLVRKNSGPRGWWIFAIAVGLAMVEVIINTEWLTITIGRPPIQDPCSILNMDFVMALIYVMFLILATFLTTWPIFNGKYKHWKKHGIFILLTTIMSIAIWIVWIVMYVYGNMQRGSSLWNDPTLSIALVSNAWTFLFFYIIPEISQITKPGLQQAFDEDVYPTRGVGYETILKEQQKSQNMFVENKAFSMDEPSAAKKPMSPYSGYNGQLRSSVYQPTEMALMNKGPGETPYDVIIPRATANTQVNSTNSTIRAEDAYAAQDARRSQNPSYPNARW